MTMIPSPTPDGQRRQRELIESNLLGYGRNHLTRGSAQHLIKSIGPWTEWLDEADGHDDFCRRADAFYHAAELWAAKTTDRRRGMPQEFLGDAQTIYTHLLDRAARR